MGNKTGKHKTRRAEWFTVLPLGIAVSLAVHAEEDQGPIKSPWELVGLHAAFERGLTGKGTTVGVIDTGFLNSHPAMAGVTLKELINRYTDVDGNVWARSPSDPTFDVDDEGELYRQFHGLSVSSVIVGKADDDYDYPGGAAPGANLVQVVMPAGRVEHDDRIYSGWTGALQALANQAPEVRVTNFSIGLDSFGKDANVYDQYFKDAQANYERLLPVLREYLQGDRLLVVAAGNEAQQQPSFLAALPRYEPELEKYFLSVVATDSEGDLAWYSNHCGISKDWCLAAPGEMIVADAYVDSDGNLEHDYDEDLGTSLAAPLVSAGAALLAERFPYFDIPQIRMTLLTTATDVGAPGVDDVYGWGLLNVEKAIDGPGQLFGDQRVVMNAALGGWHAKDEWGNDIVAGGRLTKAGSGQLGLFGNNRFDGVTVEDGRLLLAGNNTFDQASHVDRGELYVTGALAGPQLQVGREGLLAGWGTIAAPTRIDGTLEAGTFGAPTFTRELALASGSTTQVEVGRGHALRLVGADAIARLGGTLQFTNSADRPVPDGQALIQTTDGARVQGGFDALQQLPGLQARGLRHDLRFGQDGVAATVASVKLPTQESQRGNARQATQALNALRDNPMALRAGAYNDWLQASLGRGHLGGLERTAGGQVYADGLSFLSRQPATLDRMMFRELGRSRVPGTTNAWMSGLSSSQNNGGRQGVQSSSERSKGVVLGLTHALSESNQLAGSLLVSEDRIGTAGGHLRLDTTQLAVGVEHAFDSFDAGPYIAANGSASYVETTGKRKQAGFGTAKGTGTASQTSSTLRTGYRWNIDGWTLEPHTGLSVTHTRLGEVREKGSDLALNVKQQRQARTSLASGIKASHNVQVGDWLLTPQLELGHDRALAGATARTRAELQGIQFHQQSASAGRDSLTAGFALSATQGAFKATLDMQGAKSARTTSSGANLTVGFKF